jgi:hypothetical protein
MTEGLQRPENVEEGKWKTKRVKEWMVAEDRECKQDQQVAIYRLIS